MKPSSPTTSERDVVLFHDGGKLGQKTAARLKQAFEIAGVDPTDPKAPRVAANAAVVALTKFPSSLLPALTDALGAFTSAPVFVFATHNAEYIDRARALGGVIFVEPLDEMALLRCVRDAANAAVERTWSTLNPAEAKALKTSLSSFRELIKTSAKGERMPLPQVNAACDTIQESLEESCLDRWLESLKHHHDISFRHSMFVCGSLAYFSHAIGIRGEDLKELTLGGFLHDAGKAKIPLAILDKAQKLDDEEWAVMRTHPEHSRSILMAEDGLTPDIVAMAVSHHERLDGGGYPDGLSGADLNDFVRLVSITDVFSALTEPRPYKEPMSREAALDLMATFNGHLDQDLVRKFREYVLDSAVTVAA